MHVRDCRGVFEGRGVEAKRAAHLTIERDSRQKNV
jgi:hypothetical protein